MFQTRWRRQQNGDAGPEGDRSPAPEAAGQIAAGSPSVRTLFALFIVAVFAFVLREAFFGFGKVEESAALFPLIIGIPSLVLALLAFGQEIRKFTPKPSFQAGTPELGAFVELAIARRRTAAIAGWIVGFFLAIWFLGFTIAAVVATFLYLKIGTREKWPMSIVLTVVAWTFFYGLFDYALHLPFPKGELFLWLGF
ncbi:MAG: tripartite tricarboxylate transporter TctB family protein [Candidatus Binatia bacterium]